MSLDSLAVIVGVGARTPFGLSAMQTGLVNRTGIPAVDAAPQLGDGIAGCFQPAVDARLQGAERAATLAAPALEEALAMLRGAPSKVAFALCLDTIHADGGANGVVAQRLWRRMLTHFPSATLEVHGADEAGALVALGKALGELRAGRLELVILGGVHTDYDANIIAYLVEHGLMCTPDSVDGRLPGEAACFVALASPESARKLRLAPLGSIVGAGTAHAEEHELPAAARALTRAVYDATSPLRAAGLRAGWMLTDLGFEQHRLLEWQTVLVRAHESLGQPYHIDMPAQRMGSLGAAALPLFMLLATEAWQGGYAPSTHALACISSDTGPRGAIVLSTS